ncbi:protein kinase [Cryptosporidium ubiquitum]|uniref:Protein kinase n=1 Tax=Cryptosporidium ubiquitum TaxID=857276 RepID=A0A1J4MMK5_9CRYT|nr:protein kinase [Cryptosporidium ubiquitum]OII75279.1 protein kinase [Cryptosporidium ubiquitum]
MAVVARKNVKLSSRNPTKVKPSASTKKESQISRGRSKTRANSEIKHHSASPHPTRCLRGVSTRATFKRSPSPRKDWPFDEAILYPPHPRVGSPVRKVKAQSSNSFLKNSVLKTNAKINSSIKPMVSQSPILKKNTHHSGSPSHHLHPTRCLRGVSTRATFKRSPSPRKDWPFDEAILYPPHPRIGSPKSPQIKNRTLNYLKKAKGSTKEQKSTLKLPVRSASNRSNKSNKFKKSPIKSINKKASPNLKNKTQEKVIQHTINQLNKDSKTCRFNIKTESIATVLDGEEEYIQSPVTSMHVGWGGKLLNNNYWGHKIAGENIIQISRAILWNEIHNGSLVWKPHKCINDFRLVSHSRELYNPYPGSSKLEVAEYIWQFRDLFNTANQSNPDFPALYELLFVKKDSFFFSMLSKLYGNPMSHESISRELFSQSLLLYHKNFVRINEVIQDQSYPFSVFVMEYLPHSCMKWNFTTQSYQAPKMDPNMETANKVYTLHGSKLIFSQVLEAIKFLHSKGVGGIYFMPESIKLSHSLDETYIDSNGIKLTKLLFATITKINKKIENFAEKSNKIEVDLELCDFWKSSKSINISNEFDSVTINHINQIIQEKKSQPNNIQDDSFLFNPMPFIEDLRNFYNADSIHNENMGSEKGKLMVKLSSPFKGMATKHKNTLFSGMLSKLTKNFNKDIFLGNKWLSPPELFNRMFNSLNSEVDLRKCDIWNLGVLLHCLLVGLPPNIVNRNVVLDRRVPPEAKNLLLSLLKVDPLLRPSIFEIEQYIMERF